MKRSSWQKALDDPRSDIAVRERERAARHESVDVNALVREILDGAVGDIDLPTSYPAAQFAETRTDGFTAAQLPVYQQIERYVVGRFGPMVSLERNRLGLAVILEWNRRAALEEERDRHADWLADYQAGDHSTRGAA